VRGKIDPKVSVESDTGVLAAFVREHAPLRRFIGRLMRNPSDVEDIAQEAFLRAFSVEQGRPIEQPKSFLFRIAKHIALNQLTQKSRQITDYIEDLGGSDVVGTGGSAEEELIARQTLGLHCDAVASLSPQCRQAYLLRKVHGMSHKEIAAHLGIAVSTVEKHLIKGVEQCDRFIRERSTSSDADQAILRNPAPKRLGRS
jgi:RNA polymerase sigma factor (sigma-70 family)